MMTGQALPGGRHLLHFSEHCVSNGHLPSQAMKYSREMHYAGSTMSNPHHKLQLSGAVTTLCSGFVTASFTIIACGSFAALIFAGPLNSFVAQGIWIGLFTALV